MRSKSEREAVLARQCERCRNGDEETERKRLIHDIDFTDPSDQFTTFKIIQVSIARTIHTEDSGLVVAVDKVVVGTVVVGEGKVAVAVGVAVVAEEDPNTAVAVEVAAVG